MENNKLFPVFDVPAVITETDVYDTKYKRSIQWDAKTGDFVRDGANRLVECDGREAYKTWCLKVAQTERYRCMAYPSEIGVEMEDALNEPDEKAVESAIERTITEALMVNPRTEFVRNFSFEADGDTVHAQCMVKAIDMDAFEISI